VLAGVRKLFGAGEGTDGFVDRAFSRRTRFLTLPNPVGAGSPTIDETHKQSHKPAPSPPKIYINILPINSSYIFIFGWVGAGWQYSSFFQ
jgi:hypothetical protein